MNSNFFQIGLIAFFIFFIIAGVLVFATFGGILSDPVVDVTVWGTLPALTIVEFVASEPSFAEANVKIRYEEKSPASIEREFVDALAEGRGPDLVLFPEHLLLPNLSKLTRIPYDSYSERDFKDTFIGAADVLLTGDGIIGLPVSVDPLVMYWNRSLYASSGVAKPISQWEETSTVVPKLRRTNDAGTLLVGALPFGTVANNRNAVPVLSALMLQSGALIVKEEETNQGRQFVADVVGVRNVSSSGESSLRFFTEFADPQKDVYTWSGSFPEARLAFLGGILATYFGFASELTDLRAGNPNLNFDVATIPQIKGNVPETYGHLIVAAVPRSARDVGASFRVLGAFTSQTAIANLSSKLNLPPVRRDLLAEEPSDAFRAIFYRSALITQTFLDPNKEATASAFADAVLGVTSGRLTLFDAVSRLETELNMALDASLK